MTLPLMATAVAILAAAAGVSLAGARGKSRAMISFSGGLLAGVAVFGLLPELFHEIGAAAGASLFAGGYLLLKAIDRYVYPVCPSCSHDHDHDSCASTLHGFAPPMIIATAFHAFLDGWSIATSEWSGGESLRTGLPLALVLHKIPEGIAIGAILRAAVRSRALAFAWSFAAESMTLAGSGSGLAMAPLLGANWLHYPLAVAGGCFFYLGFHAVHGEWRRSKTWSSFAPGLGGAAGAAVLMWRGFLR